MNETPQGSPTSAPFYAEEATAGRVVGGAVSPGTKSPLAGGQMVLSGRGTSAYTAVLTYEDGTTTSHPFETLREGEAFIRSETPMPRSAGRLEPFPHHQSGKQDRLRFGR